MNYNNKDFAGYLQSFFEEHLVKECNRSPNTIRSYRDTFIHLIKFMKDERRIAPDRLSFDSFDRGIILHFLNWLESTMQSSSSTRNQRYQAIRSFFRYMMLEDPTRLNKWQSICSIKVKVSVKNTVNYLTVEGLKCILEQIPTNTSDGRRNLTLLSLMYNLGARVQELIDLTPSSIRMAKPYVVEVLGKGSKKRVVPLDDCMMKLLISYMKENRLDRPGMDCHSLFYNCWGSKLTTPGVTYILSKYADKARLAHPGLIPEKLSPHSLRHSRAVHMLQAGVELILIRYPNKNIILTFKKKYLIFRMIIFPKLGLYLNYFPLLNNADNLSLPLPHFCGNDLVFSSSNDSIAFACISIVISR